MKCECENAGYCQILNREMHGRMHSICQGTSGLDPTTEQSYRDLWLSQTKSKGLGDTIARLVRKVFRGMFRPTPGCGCNARKDWLNKYFPYFWKKTPKPSVTANPKPQIDNAKLQAAINAQLQQDMKPIICQTCEEMAELVKTQHKRQVTMTIQLKSVLK